MERGGKFAFVASFIGMAALLYSLIDLLVVFFLGIGVISPVA
jgi:hypothetical protein